MQYLLSEEEMEAVRQDRLALSKMPDSEALLNVVKHVATQMIDPTRRSTTPHGCIHVPPPSGDERYRTRYCDYCSVAGICPQPKRWSK